MTHRRALLIGIDACDAAPLWGAANDVGVVRAEICTRFGFTTTLLLNRDATRDGILNALDAFVDGAKRDDVLLLYFAGHGTQVTSDFGDGSTRESLCPCDYLRDEPSRAITNLELHRRFTAVMDREARLTAIFDCCFAGGIPPVRATRSVEPKVRCVAPVPGGFRGDGSTPRVFRIADVPTCRDADGSLVVFGACPFDTVAREHWFGKQVRGVFTHHLTEVVRRCCPGPSNGEVRDAVEQSVHADASLLGYTQIPVISPASAKTEPFLGLSG